jgi:hypothetical protein
VGRSILPLEANGGWQNCRTIHGFNVAQCRPQDRFQTRPEFSGFFPLAGQLFFYAFALIYLCAVVCVHILVNRASSNLKENKDQGAS